MSDETVRVTTLDNGLRVASDLMTSVETVSLGVWAAVGTRDEPPELNGASHMLEHMAFKGTERRSAQDIAVEIESVGGQINAYTTRERTAYYTKLLAGDLPLGLDILADILQHSVFDPGELERERAVILQEIGQAEDTPDDIVFDHFQAEAYPDQPLGRPVLGTMETVTRLGRAEIQDYQRRSYGPERLVLGAAGQLDHDRLVELARSLFTDLPAGRPPPSASARYEGGDRRTERNLEQVHLVLGFEGVGYLDPDYYVQSVFSTLYGGGMSSRLFQEVREKRGLVYSIYSYAAAYADSGLFTVYAGTGETEAAEVLPLIAEELHRLPDTLTREEIARAKAQIRADLLMARESTSARAEHLAHQLLAYGRPIPTAELLARIEAVDAAALARFARRLAASRPTLAALGPVGRLPTAARVAQAFAA
ncbi:MAG: M16 family metallopeptidase [Pseudomonadota bacterium]